MLVLFAVGVMSIFWMLVVTGLIFAEKVLPGGERVARAVAVALVALGLWIAISPATLPALTTPSEAMAPSGNAMPMR
jgi:predicted metal-binding membrane protein